MSECQKKNIRLRIVPSMETRLGGTTIPIRELNIEDLLKREPIKLDDSIIEKLLFEQKVLVTGAGGSIGSEICRQIIRFKPETLIILGRGENRIFFLERELRQLGYSGNLIPIIGDVTNESRMEQVFREHTPKTVFHAAAHKHVPLMETNISEAIYNNVQGTKVVADMSDRFGTNIFVLISTDKAVNPTSVMGVTKHLAERYIHSLSLKSKTKFVATRFGNVLGSAGSVVPIFRKQIAEGGPVTVTDFRMTRYFMTIPEASQLVLQAAAMCEGGEIFVLDMGEPVRIVDLAKDLIRLSGLPENAIEIRETGMRPGEKLYEELYFESEKAVRTSHPKLRCAAHRRFDWNVVNEQIQKLLEMTNSSVSEIHEKLQEIVEEYQPEHKTKTVPFTTKSKTDLSVYSDETNELRKTG
jgi:FlaA1/EpsC-like NDP-sugar epimerase